MHQNFSNSDIRSGSGGSSGRGGDIGSHNTSNVTYKDSNNDNSTRQRVDGDNYSGVHNTHDSQESPLSEEDLLQRIKAAREKLAAKKELERLKKLEEELKELEAELEA